MKIAVIGLAVPITLRRVEGIAGKAAIDATNPTEGRPAGFPSLAHLVKSLTGAPVAKAFDTVTPDSTTRSRRRDRSRAVCGAGTTRSATSSRH